MSSTKPLRIFSPVIVFHDTNKVQPPARINEYKEKIMQMMEQNAKRWSLKMTSESMENNDDLNVSPSTSTSSTKSSSSASSCDSIETIDTIHDQQHHHVVVDPYSSPSKQASNDDRTTKMRYPPLSSSCSSPTFLTPRLPTTAAPRPRTPHATAAAAACTTNSNKVSNDGQKKKRRGNLPKEVTEFLKRWLVEHKKHPYPSEKEKIDLAHQTGLTVNQISNWFINARRRILQPMLESEGLQAHLLSYSSSDHHRYLQRPHSAFSASPASSLSSPILSYSPTSPSSLQSNVVATTTTTTAASLMEQKKRRQLDIYAYQGFADSHADDTRKWAFRRTKLPNFEMNDCCSVTIR
ncbi:hypothetical protein BCR42DRAFT_410468 [Absidia repens]|uniref:Homeobox domain-containing protein n=1 Tax=Absidia repens TaxID=90262 RepID=A0A1X2IP26_9FUNG|nr:hypothetical protein BCR42DRAFT_410468 [Absidia repens]